jgi:predicted signal transduction protein with EAL and GGDEF domain
VLRHGGDEFVVLIPEGDDGAGLRAGATRLLAALDEPFRLAGCEFSLSTSVGVAVYPDDGRDAEILLDRADMAMYRAKEAGRNGVEFFTPGMDSVGGERLSLEYALRGALDRDELVLHYQPLMSADGRLVGAEALVRWQHPELGLLLPGRFIPIAEESGLILSLGKRVLHAVCAQLAAWRAAGLPLVPVAVNISALQFRRADFVDSIAAALRRHDIPAGLLTLELTESMVMRDVEQVARQLAELKALGVSIAIDDFGTGYSSLAYLKRFPSTSSRSTSPSCGRSTPARRPGHRRLHRRPRPQPGPRAGGRGRRDRVDGQHPAPARLRRAAGLVLRPRRAGDIFAARLGLAA